MQETFEGSTTDKAPQRIPSPQSEIVTFVEKPLTRLVNRIEIGRVF